MAFAVGVLVWGQLSDRWGRRRTMLLGILVYLIGNIGLFAAPEFGLLLLVRLVQTFGASVGSRRYANNYAGKLFRSKRGPIIRQSWRWHGLRHQHWVHLLGGIIQQYFGFKSLCSVLNRHGDYDFDIQLW